MIRFLNWLASRLPTRRIESREGDLYLSRTRIYGWMPWDDKPYPFSIYLHRFHRPDLDMALHNHPWKWSFSFVLAGGYFEQRLIGGVKVMRRVRPFTFNFLGVKSFHRVDRLCGKETWTLFIAGPKFKSWGFLDEDRGFVEWREYLGVPNA